MKKCETFFVTDGNRTLRPTSLQLTYWCLRLRRLYSWRFRCAANHYTIQDTTEKIVNREDQMGESPLTQKQTLVEVRVMNGRHYAFTRKESGPEELSLTKSIRVVLSIALSQ